MILYKHSKEDGFEPIIKKSVDTFSELEFLVSIGEGIAIASQDVAMDQVVKMVKIEGTKKTTAEFAVVFLLNSLNQLRKPFLNLKL